jgi:glycosyltransferase involved in cell wall biosynthesis
MEKIKILVLPSDKSGVGKYRSVDPHVKLQNMYPDDFHVTIDYNPNLSDLNYFKDFHIVHAHRSIGHDIERTPELIKKINTLGVIVIIDLDDYWMPGYEHPLYTLIVQENIGKKITNNLRAANYVTTTTKIFATEIGKYNKNVVIFPNAIDPNEIQFKETTKPSEKLRVGWLGGSSHLHDIKLLESSFAKFTLDERSKLQFYLCGFDTRGTVTEINNETKKQTQRAMRPEETVWAKYEEIITNNYFGLPEKYINFLKTYKEEDYPGEINEPYMRVWTRPVQLYAKNYSKFDVSLAPIKNTAFNRFKSQLKVIEAGFYKKALIASNIGPYTIDLKHSVVNGKFIDGNALLVDENRNHSDWFKSIKLLLNNRNMVEDLGENLYNSVKDMYDLNIVTKQRAEFYKSIIK